VNGEREFISRIERRAGALGAGLILGIGDDCAIFRPRGAREDLLFTTDLLLEDVHFRRNTHTAADVGWKALARGLSDIAAMGGEPRFCLLSLALADWVNEHWTNEFYRGLLRLARRTGVTLAGGDVARGSKFACDIVVCGALPRGRALRRDGARPHDAIYVSGRLGGPALGLAQGPSGPQAAWRRHVRPQPRLELGRFLRERLHATAAIDLSDGLSIDLARLCQASKVSAAIEPPPRFPGATAGQALHGGEDYELLFTVSARTGVPARWQGLPLTRIGEVRKGRPGRVLLGRAPLEPLGYDHLRAGRPSPGSSHR
jgi:thiamine-monophosphate kinase